MRPYDINRKRSGKHRLSRKRIRTRDHEPTTVIGIDGEGYDTPDGKHLYVYLCAVNEYGKVLVELHDPRGLDHHQAMQLLLGLPKRSVKFGFSFGYDLTMLLKDALEKRDIYRLYRPHLRMMKKKKRSWRKPIYANGGYGYDWLNGAFTVSDKKARAHIWDCFRFFQCSFVDALDNWQIGTESERDEIRRMKNLRGEFATHDIQNVKHYCQKECHLLALMMRALIEAHKEVGLELKRYDGVGSTASVLLKKHGVAEYRGSYEGEIEQAVHRAFFGGRFENSRIGMVTSPVYSYDIASAYPYAETFLPCFACGKWRRIMNERELTQFALVVFEVLPIPTNHEYAWLPLPFRSEDGSISYPCNFRGTVWADEYRQASMHFPELVRFRSAWVYETDCCHQPFSFLPDVYRQRIQWGKDSKGIVLKLGTNATYGKTAQTIGENPPFRELAWAGLTTSITRAMLLELMARAYNPWSIISVATDGITSLEKLDCPPPVDRGTNDLAKPLGSWEEKVIPEGMFFAKPGVYFRLANAEVSEMRARGLGRREVFEQRERLVEGFRRWDRVDPDYYVSVEMRRFFGAKHCIYGISRCLDCKATHAGYLSACVKCLGRISFEAREMTDDRGQPLIGNWRMRESRVRFSPLPKRSRVLPGDRLETRDMGGATSEPYRRGMTSPEGEERRQLREFLTEQPDED